MNVSRHLPGLVLAGAAMAAGWGSVATETAAQAQQTAGGGKPRVFFIEPKDGATVKSPVALRFGIENYGIAAVPEGDVTKSRPNVGHHHVAINTKCLPPGTVIPKAAPWVHFGDGKNVIDMQLPPGKHTLTLQLGDDTHTTIEGLCSTITVNVVE
jgi:hypothetical protein